MGVRVLANETFKDGEITDNGGIYHFGNYEISDLK